MENSISRITILNAILSNFQGSIQWFPTHMENVADRYKKAEALIEILEVADCGSVGGYDKKNGVRRETKFHLFDRFLALVRKYDSEEELNFGDYADLYELQKFFINLNKLRDNI